MVLDKIKDMLATCSEPNNVFPPTTLYNEGWMLRLVLDWFANNSSSTGNHQLRIPNGGHWYSEALLQTQFKPVKEYRTPKDELAESHTHADGVIGQFVIGGNGKGDLVVDNNTKHIVILEAKMYSPLSAGIKNVEDYNQAARIVACMANAMSIAKRKPSCFDCIGFYLLLPERNAVKHNFIEQMDPTNIISAIKKRKEQYKGRTDYSDKCDWFNEYLVPMVKIMKSQKTMQMITWEDIIEYIRGCHDDLAADEIDQFYEECKKYN